MKLQPTDYTFTLYTAGTIPGDAEKGLLNTDIIPAVVVGLPACDRRFAKKVMRSIVSQHGVKYSDFVRATGFKELR